MANPQIEQLLSTCPQPESGCFASNPDAVEAMLYFSDSGIRTTLQRVAESADEAATAGVPFEDATYKTVTIDPVGQLPPSPFDHENRPGIIAELGEGDEKRVADLESGDSIDQLAFSVASCAYACASAAAGSCVLKKKPT